MSSKRALLIYVAVAASIFGAVWGASALTAETKRQVFRFVGVSAMPFAFADTEVVLAWLDCYRAGRDMRQPCDFGYSHLPLNYPKTWLALAALPIGWKHAWPVAVIMESLLFLVTVLLVLPYPRAAVWPTLGALASPPLLLALERANADVLIFLFLFGACLAGGWVASVLIAVAGALKIYPIAAVISIADNGRKRTWAAAALALVLFAGFCFTPLANWSGVVLQHTQSATSSFDHQVLPEILNESLSKRGVRIEPLLRVGAIVIFLGLLISTPWLAKHLPAAGAPATERDRRLIVCAMAVFLACFAMGHNYDYRHIHFLLAIPALSAIAAQRRWICLEGLFLALLLAALWLTYDGAHTACRATQELVEWLLVPLSGVLLVQNLPGRVRGSRGAASFGFPTGLCLVDHDLKASVENIGHSRTYAEAALQSERVREIWARKTCDITSPKVRRLFWHSEFAIRNRLFRPTRLLRWPSTLAAALVCNFAYALAVLSVPQSRGRILFAINTSIHTVFALQLYAWLHPEECVLAYFQVPAGRGCRLVGHFHRLLRLRNLRYATELEVMAQSYSRYLGFTCISLPIPLPSRTPPPPSPALAKTRALTGLLLGHPRLEKGFDIAVSAIAALAPELTAGVLRFEIQSASPCACEEGVRCVLNQLAALQRSVPGIEVFHGPISEAQYASRLSGADFLVLPYRQDAYSLRSSGIIMEGLAASKPAVVTQGLSFSTDPDVQRCTVQFADGDSRALAESIRQLIGRFDQLKQEAERVQNHRLKLHNMDYLISRVAEREFWTIEAVGL